jgi:hypothetical protein
MHHDELLPAGMDLQETKALDAGDATTDGEQNAWVPAEIFLGAPTSEEYGATVTGTAEEDQGIAPEASDASRTDATETPSLNVPEDVRDTSDDSPDLPLRSTFGVRLVSHRAGWQLLSVPSRIVRTAHSRRVSRLEPRRWHAPGVRYRSRRSAGRFSLLGRSFPPRSPPRPRAAAERVYGFATDGHTVENACQ